MVWILPRFLLNAVCWERSAFLLGLMEIHDSIPPGPEQDAAVREFKRREALNAPTGILREAMPDMSERGQQVVMRELAYRDAKASPWN